MNQRSRLPHSKHAIEQLNLYISLKQDKRRRHIIVRKHNKTCCSLHPERINQAVCFYAFRKFYMEVSIFIKFCCVVELQCTLNATVSHVLQTLNTEKLGNSRCWANKTKQDRESTCLVSLQSLLRARVFVGLVCISFLITLE